MNDNYVKHTHVALFSISRLRFEGEVCYLIAAKPGSRASRSTQLACSLHVTQPGPPLHAPAPRQGWADHQDQDALKSEYTHSSHYHRQDVVDTDGSTGEEGHREGAARGQNHQERHRLRRRWQAVSTSFAQCARRQYAIRAHTTHKPR
jgi:hypothetical protein